MKKPRAQIVATVGPASKDIPVLKALIESGMDVARLNFSWGTHEEHASRISTIRTVAKGLGKHIPIIQDLSGPRIQETSGHQFDTTSAHVITEKDIRDLHFGIAQKVEYVAMSFVGDASDIHELRKMVKGTDIKIIAKIERAKAVENLAAIIEASDAIMVARGDLGNEIPLEQIPYVQLDIIKSAKKAGKPVITATQMMLSMVDHPTPTRAEVSDVAYAVIEGSDAVMLSEESAQGKYPVETVAMMEKIISEAERHEYKPIVNRL